MFVSANQAYVFIAAIAFGGAAGIIYFPVAAIKSARIPRILGIVSDAVFFVFFSAAFVFFSYSLSFPSFRAYMAAGALVGFFLSRKSFGVILAKIAKKLYNIIRKIILTVRKKGKTLYGRKKKNTKEKRLYHRRGSSRPDSSRHNGLPDGGDKRKKSRFRRIAG